MTETPKKNEAAEASSTKESSFSFSETFKKIGNALTGQEWNAEQKKSMEDTIGKQRKELADIVEKYKQGKTEIVGESKQDRLSLFLEVKNTISYMNNMSAGGIPDGQDGVVESAYEKLEERITGTRENVDFKNPEFIKQAIATLEKFASDLGGAQKQNAASWEPGKTPKEQENTKDEPKKGEDGTIPQRAAEQNAEKTLKVGKLGELADKTPLKVTGKDVNFRDEKNKSLGKIDGNVSVSLDLAGDRKPTQYKEHTMIPVTVWDGAKAYIAEKYLAKKEGAEAPKEAPKSSPEAKK